MRNGFACWTMLCSLASAIGASAVAQPAPPPGATATPAPLADHPATPRELPAVTFSKLVFRVDRADAIGVAKQDYRVFILEDLRARGFNAVGAESLVFEKDDSDRADYVLGGTIHEVECKQAGGLTVSCYLGIEWELLDSSTDQVVYRATIREAEYELDKERAPSAAGKRLVLGSLRRLVSHPRLLALLRSPAAARAAIKPDYSLLSMKLCQRDSITLPADADKAIAATVMIESKGIGSGFLVNDDGMLLTAAHVVSTPHPMVTLSNGAQFTANVLRLSRDHDVALLQIAATQGMACLPPMMEVAKQGTEIYAIGAPASRQLAFSLTRGIVSGLRDFDGVSFVQTDASVSPGYSGGPLVDNLGRAVGVVSWKVAGGAIEGVAFGVPAATAFDALSLEPDDHSDPALATPLADLPGARQSEVQVDPPDPIPSLDPEHDRKVARAAAAAERARRIAAITPGYVPILRYGGLALCGLGLAAAAVTAHQYDRYAPQTHSEYESARLGNDLSWVAAGAGAVAFFVSFFLVPSLPDEQAPSRPGVTPRHARTGVGLGLGALSIEGRY